MLRDLRIPFFTILFLFLSIFIYTKLAGPLPFSVTSFVTNKQNLFTVQGTGEKTSVPDTALVTLGVTKQAATVEIAQNQVNQISNQLTKDLQNLKIPEKDIKTTNYTVNPSYDFSNGRQTITGYSVNATIEVRMKQIEQANKAIDIATKDGANHIGNVQFILDDETRKELENQARKDAITAAKNKAQTIANDAGIKLGRIVDVQENSSAPQPFVNRVATLDQVAEKIPTELNPGENTISVTVTLSYETY